MPLWIHLKPKLVGKGCEREKIKIIVPFRSFPIQRLIKNSKTNRKKIQKTKIYYYGFV